MKISELFNQCINGAKQGKGFNSGGLSWIRYNKNQAMPVAIAGCYLNLVMEVREDDCLYIKNGYGQIYQKVSEGYNFKELKEIAEKWTS